jgi:hypothetical protein
MKMSTVIRRAITRAKKQKFISSSCVICSENFRRNESCFTCPVNENIKNDIFNYKFTCAEWPSKIYNGDEEAIRLAYEIALACEMQGD